MFEKLLFESKFVFLGGAVNKVKSRYSTPKDSADAQDAKEKRDIADKQTMLSNLATVGKVSVDDIQSSGSIEKARFQKMLDKISNSKDGDVLEAATLWCVRSNSAYFDKRSSILNACIHNKQFYEMGAFAKIISNLHLVSFTEKRIKQLVKGITRFSGDNDVVTWLRWSMGKLPKTALAKFVNLMPNTLKRRILVNVNAKIRRYNADQKINKARKYAVLFNVLMASLKGGRTPKTTPQKPGVRNALFKPSTKPKRPTVTQIKHRSKPKRNKPRGTI